MDRGSVLVIVRTRKTLPPLLERGVDLVIVGTEPGPTSLQRGEYYANPNNSFYADLAVTAVTPERVSPTRFRELLAFGIGLDDVYDDPRATWRRIERVAPLAVCFNSKEALQRFLGVSRLPSNVWRGAGARRFVEIAEITWALDDSSPTARRYHELRLQALRQLRTELKKARGRARRHRCYAKLRSEDLDRLLELELEWRTTLERRHTHWQLYSDRLLGVCLAQGGAKHLIDGHTGIKDFDVYRIFAAHPKRPNPDPAIYRGRTTKDFGPSRFGTRTDWWGQRRFGNYRGRNVDIFSAALPASPTEEPIPAIRRWLRNARTDTEKALAAKALVLIGPRQPQIAWPDDADGEALFGYGDD